MSKKAFEEFKEKNGGEFDEGKFVDENRDLIEQGLDRGSISNELFKA